MTSTFNNIVNEVRACTLCSSHLPLPAKPIIQHHSSAQILIAGQAPGIKAHNSGIPFDDASGKRLREWMGVDKTLFYNPEKNCHITDEFLLPRFWCIFCPIMNTNSALS